MFKSGRRNVTQMLSGRLRLLLILTVLCVPLVSAAAAESERLAGPTSLVEALGRFEKVDLPQLCEKEPFRAAAYLGAAACFEKLKVALDRADAAAIGRAEGELSARLDLLETGELPAGTSGLLKLLRLAAIPEAQVVVEYPYPNVGTASFYWGSMPMVGAWVSQFKNEREVARSFEGERQDIFVALKRTKFDGLPALVSNNAFDYEPVPWTTFDPEQEVLLIAAGRASAFSIRLDGLPHANVEAAVVLESSSPSVRKAVEGWARAAGVPLVGLKDALGKGNILVAGDITTPELREVLEKTALSAVEAVPDGYHLMAFKDLWRASVWGPTREVAEAAARLVLAGEPVRPADVDAIRALIVSQLAPAAEKAALPEGMALYSGDVHMHTIYSDGTPTPVGLALQAMYCFLDYAAITDHDTIEGAQVAAALLQRNGFAYPLTVSEEITASWSHFNAYPLKEVISPLLSLDAMVTTAHRQGAVIQWNHPELINSDWTRLHLKEGIGKTGLDAWEHVPSHYEAWVEKWTRAGYLPVITGSTDTHNGTFSRLERTIILAPSAQGDDVAEAIRRRQVVALYPNMPRFLYGPSKRVISLLWTALADGDALKSSKAERLRSVLKDADLVALLKESPAKDVKPQEALRGL